MAGCLIVEAKAFALVADRFHPTGEFQPLQRCGASADTGGVAAA